MARDIPLSETYELLRDSGAQEYYAVSRNGIPDTSRTIINIGGEYLFKQFIKKTNNFKYDWLNWQGADLFIKVEDVSENELKV